MRKINTHKVNPANDTIEINVVDSPGMDGANHKYEVIIPNRGVVCLNFQDGPINQVGVNGITQEVLLAICEDRLASFQSGPYACMENAKALNHLIAARGALNDRTIKRTSRGVEGTHTI